MGGGEKNMKKILLFVYPTFAEFEVTVATALLKDDYKIETVGVTKNIITSETSSQVKQDCKCNRIWK